MPVQDAATRTDAMLRFRAELSISGNAARARTSLIALLAEKIQAAG
jgi:hypothetical protein